MKRKLNAICMICDDAYVLPCVVAMTSLWTNSKNPQHIKIYICVNQMSDTNLRYIAKMSEAPWNLDIELVKLDLEKYRSIYTQYDGNTGAGSITALAKFDLPQIIDEDVVLYLDGDILVQHDIMELLTMDLGDKVAGVVLDSGKIYNKSGLRGKLPKYFNSGVMLLNLRMMREGGFTQKLIDAKIKLNNPKLVDQDAFNIAFRGLTKLLPIQYNALLVNLHNSCAKFTMTALNSFYGTAFSSLYDLDDNVNILHFASKEKPWKYDDVYYSTLWMAYYHKSPLAHIELSRTCYHVDDEKVASKVDTIPVMLATDGNYFPQTYVTILSIVKNRTSKAFLAFHILMPEDVSDERKRPFFNMQHEYPNVSISFIIMGKELFADAKLSIKHISSPTFYRLKAPRLFPQYNKILYVDSDVIVERDLSELMGLDIGDCYIAGVKAASYHYAKNGNALYCQQNGLPAIDQYVNAGVLVMNLDALRRENIEDEFIRRAKLGYRSQDQDVINGACYGHIFQLPYKYNCQITKYEPVPDQTRKIWSAEVIREAENQPIIIHYAAEVKPWADLSCALSDRWWKYALQTPYQEYFISSFFLSCIRNGIVSRIGRLKLLEQKQSFERRFLQCANETDRLTKEMIKCKRDNVNLISSESYRVGMFVTWPARKVYGGIKCLRENGVKYTFKHIIGKVLRKFGSKCGW